MATYTATNNLDDLVESNPTDLEQANKLGEVTRETRTTLKNVIKAGHNSDGSHKDDSITSAALVDDSVTNEKIASSVADTTKGIERDVTTKKLQIKLDSTYLEVDVSGNITIKAGADLSAFLIGAGVITGTNLTDGSIFPVKLGHGEAAAGAAKLLIQQADGTIAAYPMSGAVSMSAGGTTSIGTVLNVARLAETQATGTNGGTLTAGSWQKRNLNIQHVDDSIVSVSAGVITFQPGTYLIFGEAPAFAVGKHTSRLYDTTNTSELVPGSSEVSLLDPTTSRFMKRVKFEAVADVELQTYCEITKANVGKGIATGFGSEEVFSNLTIVQIG